MSKICPILHKNPNHIHQPDCVEGSCALWDSRNHQCSILTFLVAGDRRAEQGAEMLQMIGNLRKETVRRPEIEDGR
jgi:hypothetical protein